MSITAGARKKQVNPHLGNVILKHDNIILKYLLANEGDSAETKNMNINGLAVPTIYKAVPPAGKYWIISRILIYYSTAGVAFSEEKFGNLTALVPAQTVQILANNTVIEEWSDNIDVNLTMYDTIGRAIFAKVDKSLSGRWSLFKFSKAEGIRIDDNVNGIGVNIRADLSTLTQFRIKVHGVQFNKP